MQKKFFICNVFIYTFLSAKLVIFILYVLSCKSSLITFISILFNPTLNEYSPFPTTVLVSSNANPSTPTRSIADGTSKLYSVLPGVNLGVNV